jgi:hypothetical protein
MPPRRPHTDRIANHRLHCEQMQGALPTARKATQNRNRRL